MMTDAELLDALHIKLLHWLKPDPQPPADETLLQMIELFEASGRGFVKVDYPAND
jgi:hypothetical protein